MRKNEPIPTEDELIRRQRAAITKGQRAEKEGGRVIYVHGRPYVDPGDAESE